MKPIVHRYLKTRVLLVLYVEQRHAVAPTIDVAMMQQNA